jgi:outer membrane receptor protein involved in Fe transport
MQQNLPNSPVENLTDSFALPDLRVTASIFYSKILFGIDAFQTGFTLSFTDSEHDAADNYQGALPTSVNEPNGLVHRICSYTTIDWQISYELGKPQDMMPRTSDPDYNKDGRNITHERTISSISEGSNPSIRRWLSNTKIMFGINNIGDVKPPFSDTGSNFDSQTASPVGRYFYVELEKKF